MTHYVIAFESKAKIPGYNCSSIHADYWGFHVEADNFDSAVKIAESQFPTDFAIARKEGLTPVDMASPPYKLAETRNNVTRICI
jgi:hypothetical protein